MFKSLYTRLILTSSIFAFAVLVVLPRIPIKIDSRWLKINSYVGGYKFSMLGGRYNFDLTQFKKGLDLNGGVKVVLSADLEGVETSEYQNAVDSAVNVIERRVNLLGVSEPVITSSKVGEDYRIIVELPGVQNVSEAISLIGETAQLRFSELKDEALWTPEKFQEYYFSPEAWQETGITGADLKGADVVFGNPSDPVQANRPQIQLRFTEEGQRKFSEVAKKNVNKPVAIFLDEEPMPISMAVVDADLAAGALGDPVISGTFDLPQARALSVQIRAGALPISVKVLEEKEIGATLGSDSITKSMFAGAIGLVLVLLFMIVMYMKLGLLADISLIVYTILVLAVFKMVPVVLTLPGIAGFILSIGMAADANILIFERVKEELQWGKPYGLAIHHGFDRAWTSIRDSNISSLITAYILFEFGTGAVKGFALTLAIGIAVSLFTSIFIVRTLIEAFNLGNVRLEK